MNYSKDINLPKSWLTFIDKTLLDDVLCKLQMEINKYPDAYFYPYNMDDIFKIFYLCDLKNINVVILGQDPYYSSKLQANGIAFSVNKNVAIPASLRNIFKEANVKSCHGDLSDWVKQGVFLLNASLTVREKRPNSHEYIWRDFIQHIINIINIHCENVIFVSWGASAYKKYDNLNLVKHQLLTSSHPSPLSCYKTTTPFIGSNVFNKINQMLIERKKTPIVWSIIQ